MELLTYFIDIVLHLDVHLLAIMQTYGMWIYAILFMIIFCETGLVVMPFLPGDSLLFVVGALCGVGTLEIQLVLPLLMLASFLGDSTNYWIGRLIGMRLVKRANSRFLKHEHLEKTQMFYKKHGGKAILFARFLPIVRTFAPFVAGIGLMRYRTFMLFSALGSIAWISLFTLGGYFLGNIPVVKNNLTLMVIIVIVISFLPALREFIRHRRTIV
ncbi:DedA family protein DedA [Candidatus Nitrotoga sp. HW29]|uniref:DedA family protein n=1 Tax=Candidatus Nitrotoga sp. HW29 TaxID=2886963 RepID=UPI001EF1D814|nr:DedA family protein [Candidatus Nitrotoga sp. HW29]CAH1905282.1 DedA family protein DedA [Candidatus Nitrotoga sp. HW29]